MAIFERTSQNKIITDDTEKLTCVVENAQNINKHTEYILRVQRGPDKDNKWNVSRRYRDFAALHTSLLSSNIELPIPPKKFIGNMQPSFIAERQQALQNYINEVLKHPILALSLQVRSFLDPSNYSLALAEQALQTVSIALRGDGRYELKGPLSDIGWRIRKHYFMVTDTESQKNCVMSWQNYGPDRYLCDKDLQAAFKSLQNISHPHIAPILTLHNLETGAFVVRRIYENGSLRDILYGTEYTENYLAKYGNPKIRRGFTDGQISYYGQQILQALKFLHDKGIPHGHIHPGNIVIESQNAMLVDIENSLMGVPSQYRPYLLELKRTTSPEAVDLYCFGRTLYEMAFGKPMDELWCDYFPDWVSDDLETVLRLCLSSAVVSHGSQRFMTLLKLPWFGCLPAPRAHLKFPLPLKEELKKAADLIEARLKAEQKMVRSAKREVRIQAILNSEEELKRHKRRMRKRLSLYKSSSSLAEAARSQSASTASSPTPAHSEAGASCPAPAQSPPARSALLDAICSFDKSRLSRVNSH